MADQESPGTDALQAAMMAGGVMSVAGAQGASKQMNLRERAGEAPKEGFQACQIQISGCSNELTNGTYLPAVPYDGKPVWHKPPSQTVAADAPAAEGEEKKSNDTGERFLYYSAKVERWFLGDELEEGGFTMVQSCGKCPMPPSTGWQKGTNIEFVAPVAEGGINVGAAMTEITKLRNIDPWEDQEACYLTMLKVLANIFNNPGEPKFCALKIENPAIQKKILRHDGARGYLEAVGFREDAGSLVIPTDRSAQAKLAHQLLEGFGNEAQYNKMRAERVAKAKEEAKKAEEADGWKRPKQEGYKDYGDGAKGGGKGPQKG